MMKEMKSALLGGVVVIAGIALIAYALLASSTSSGGHMGFGEGDITYSATNIVLSAVGGGLVVAGSAFILLQERRRTIQHPVSSANLPSSTANRADPEIKQGSEEKEKGEDLVLRLLEGDERRMYEAILNSNGEALQKDLILRTRMSNAKASRVIDRLEQRGLIVKERYGATNRIKVKDS